MCVQVLLEQQDTGALQGAGRSEEEEGNSLQWQRVAQLLGGKYDRIDPAQALPLLPLQVIYRRCQDALALPLAPATPTVCYRPACPASLTLW